MNVEVVGDEIAIDVVVTDPVAARVLESCDPTLRLGALADMIEIGARVIQRQHDGAQGELLRREVERMEGAFAHAQRDLIDLAGRDFSQAMQGVMVEVSQQLSRVQGQLEGALAVSAKEAELAAERERGTAKGRPFEAEVADYVADIARICGDSADHTGDVGDISGRAGDVVVEVGGAGGAPRGRIVFEAKAGRLSKPEAMRQLDRALETRGADFAVLVVAGRERIPAGLFDLQEYGGNKIVCSLDDLSHNAGLELAYALARARVLMCTVDHDGADVEGAQKAIEQALQQMDTMRQIKLKLTSIQGAAEDTKGLVEQMIFTIRSMLERAQEALAS